ncbi:spermidine acetyltransferase [Bacillus manliponensis]|uniref:Spermidine acetyltransferase n=1 Tax=Bacillus manliponensis TaxID=574376 RepID=A0A073K0M5_9BACI|nr:edeine self-resistance N-acetyltransferase EdeQ [Bacillus manliponensis]KEK20106.1 spermidine acetyltransferase [Bacillus manliponensis]
MSTTLREITLENWEECIELKATPEQSGFVASNLYSIAESKFQPTFVPLAIYHDDTMVGFVMYGLDPDDGNYWIYRLLIDAKHQRKGYGRAAISQVIELLKAKEDCHKVLIGYEPANSEAENLYTSLGFRKNGMILFGETIAELTF